ncbi:MAG TPA: UDP-N-acetylmuramoyl-L-alanyl-D-glutamate--2,6-diaminopimelate ligase [Solirubrobacteraceae bacterium]|nr:UDP-N-acetylmuramoyl-L-alanyl-D-glutamate--2,6-diaminopimelate ligase [Solirubrobacteraceae bacterium]
MRLDEVISGAPASASDIDVTDLAYDHRAVRPGTLFFCVPGQTRDGHEFADEAVKRGAVALVGERVLHAGVPEIVVPSVRAAMAPAASRLNGDPTAQLEVVGVTGTNGKTTTAYLVRALLEADGRACGLLGTVKSVIGGESHTVVRTTPEAIDLQRTFRGMVEAGDVACAMEVSSHALAMHRADAIHFAVAIFTNLSRDHLDFHPTMEDYFAAKRRLFDELGPRTAVVNIDDERGRELARSLADPITYGLESGDADYRAIEVQTGLAGSRFVALTPDGPLQCSSPLRGVFNVYNVLGALAAARALDVAGDVAAEAISHAGQVPGRFEPVDEGQEFAVLVDYAHTPQALENVLLAARQLTRGRLHVVFGAGGDRDPGKRAPMGEVARRLADRVIVTSDNPRSEDPEAIIAEVLAGAGSDTPWNVDRRQAIAEAIAGAEAGDVVVIAGKGHEQGQEFAAGHKVPFDDREVAREVLRRDIPSVSHEPLQA